MNKAPSILLAEQYTDKDLIESILASFYIIDYGFITTINGDKTVNVTHAKRLKTTQGQSLAPTISKNIEVLTLSTAGLAIDFDIQQGDKVLLLGLKNYVEKTSGVTIATETREYLHYSRETMKAVPLAAFDETAKVKVKAENGSLSITTNDKIKLNGEDKQLVTYAELNQALQQLWTSIQTHTHTVATSGTAAAQSGTAAPSTELASATLDISGAKTTTVVTGG